MIYAWYVAHRVARWLEYRVRRQRMNDELEAGLRKRYAAQLAILDDPTTLPEQRALLVEHGIPGTLADAQSVGVLLR